VHGRADEQARHRAAVPQARAHIRLGGHLRLPGTPPAAGLCEERRPALLRAALSFGERAQVLLLAKAVVVAVAGREWLWPAREHPGAVGLVYLYSAVCASLAALFALRRAADALLVGTRTDVLPLGLCT
jgi:hypothetical protein